MRTNILTTLVAAGALTLGVQQANAAFINGAVAIGAPVTPNNDDLTLATSLDIDEANAFVQPGTQQGDFVGVANGLAGVMSFVSSMAINGAYGLPYQVYELSNGIKLTLTQLTESSNDESSIVLEGGGIFTAPGKDPTFGDFDITVIRSVSGSGTFYVFNFATTSAVEGRPVVVPDGGVTAMLLGLGFIGLSGIRRKLS